MRFAIFLILAGLGLAGAAVAQKPGNWWYVQAGDGIMGWGDNEIDYGRLIVKGRRFILFAEPMTDAAGSYRWMAHEYLIDCNANTYALPAGEFLTLDRRVVAAAVPLPPTKIAAGSPEQILKVAICDARPIAGERKASSMAEAIGKAEAALAAGQKPQ